MYNQHTRGMVTTRHRSLVERGGRKALLKTLHTQNNRIVLYSKIGLPSYLSVRPRQVGGRPDVTNRGATGPRLGLPGGNAYWCRRDN